MLCVGIKNFFCTVKNGVRSNLRDKLKTARSIDWIKEGLVEVTGVADIKIGIRSIGKYFDFVNQYSDYTWGSVPAALTNKSVKEIIEEFIISKTK